jgi:hypothetical protein
LPALLVVFVTGDVAEGVGDGQQQAAL